MLLTMLEQDPHKNLPWDEVVRNLQTYGVQAVVIGIAMVFIILGILIGVIYLVRLLMNMKGKSNSSEQIVTNVVVVDEDEERRVVAAITAAIAMIYESEAQAANALVGEKVDFVVRNIKRIR